MAIKHAAGILCVSFFALSSMVAASGNNTRNLTTFNTYQIVIAPHKEESREAQFDVIREQYAHKTDVYCLQELFYPDDIQTYQEELADLYPYSYSELDEWDEDESSLPQVSCPSELAAKLQAFHDSIQETVECFEECEDDFLHQTLGTLQYWNCIIAECLIPIINEEPAFEPMSTLFEESEESEDTEDEQGLGILDFLRDFQSSRCLHCLGVALMAVLEDPELSWTDMLSYCTTEIDYNYKPTSGLLLLSKYPLSNQRMIGLPSSFDFPRAMIMADIEIENEVLTETVTVGCIHPQAPYPNATRKDSLYPFVGFDQVIMDLRLTTFTELMALQMLLIGNHIDRAERYQDFILMGDFNVGPGFVQDVYDKFMEMTYMQNIFSDEELVEQVGCTFCADNSFNGEVDEGEEMIDHIVHRQISYLVSVRDKYRCYDEMVEYEVDGVVEERHLSDHYGICSSLDFFVPV